MNNVTAVISMLHEPPSRNSATRIFRQQPVLAWTLERLWMCEQLDSVAILCWDDQLEAVQPLANERDGHILSKNPRMSISPIDSVAAARRWADGWRGGLLSTCDFDLGFHGPWVMEVIQRLNSEAVILVDPSAGLVDPKIIANLIHHAIEHENAEICFTQSPPGLGGALLKSTLVEKLASVQLHPGRLLHYLPDQPMRDPLGGEGCVAIPTPVARSTRSFRLDSDRQVNRLTDAAIHLNGQLVSSDAEDLLNRLNWTAEVDSLPREVVLELNTNRATSPIFWPGKFHSIQREPISIDTAKRIFEQLGDDVRLTLSGVGDPLLHPQVFEIIESARSSGISAIHMETDLLADETAIHRLAESNIDVVSVHLPATAQATYAAVMGCDRFVEVIENIKRFVTRKLKRNSGVPILVPLFMKTEANLAEMEAWYDQWLKAVNAATITGPGNFAGLIPDAAVADMSPPRRKPCGRLWSRMSILSDGRVVSCEQDVSPRQVVGDANQQSIKEIWQTNFAEVAAHTKLDAWRSTRPAPPAASGIDREDNCMNVLGIILARAGSQGLKNKHMLPLMDRPLISYTFEHARSSHRLARVVVSTDCPQIRMLAQSEGFTTIVRPAELATSEASVQAAMLHAMYEAERGTHFRADALVVLYGNIPVRGAAIIDRAIDMLESTGCDSVRSFCPVGKWHPAWMSRLDDGKVFPLQPGSIHRRQDLEPLFLHDGAVVAVSRMSMLHGQAMPDDPHAFFGIDRRGIETEAGETVEIDQLRDLYWAEAVLRDRRARNEMRIAS